MMISGLVSGYFIEAVLTQFSLQQVPAEPHYFQRKRNQKRVLCGQAVASAVIPT